MFLSKGPPILIELLEGRKVIENYNVTMAAKKINHESLRSLDNILHKMDEEQARGNLDAYSTFDAEFHLMIGKIAGNRFLLKALRNISGILVYQQQRASRLPNIMKVVPPQHRQIFDALRKGNPDIASKLITKHLDDVITIWEPELKKNRSLNEQAARLRPSLFVEKEVSI